MGGEFDIEANFVIQDPKNVLQMLNLLQTCPETLQVSLSLLGPQGEGVRGGDLG